MATIRVYRDSLCARIGEHNRTRSWQTESPEDNKTHPVVIFKFVEEMHTKEKWPRLVFHLYNSKCVNVMKKITFQ